MSLSFISLDPVWVPYTAAELKQRALKPQRSKGRGGEAGPKGEPADSGKWRLRFPDGRIYSGPTISVSALETASECLNKWGLSRLFDLDRAPNHKGDLGQICHDELEAWEKFGKAPKIEGMSKVLRHFPMPGECESEVLFGFAVYFDDGTGVREIVISGYVDVRVSMLEVPGSKLSVVYDLKTTGSWDWKKLPAALRSNLQGCVYALAEMLRVEKDWVCDVVVLRWVYALLHEAKDGTITLKKFATVDDGQIAVDAPSGKDDAAALARWENRGVLVSREHAVEVLSQYLPMAVRMLDAIAENDEAKKAGRALTAMPKSADACHSYGGCGWAIAGGTTGPKGQLPSPSAKPGEACCEVPAGGGFMSMLKQSRARLGIETGVTVSGVGGGFLKIGKTTAPSGHGEKKMGLEARFGNRGAKSAGVVGGGSDAAVAAAKPVAAVVPAAAAAAAAPAKGLGARFAKSGSVSAAAPTVTVAKSADVKVASDGMAAKGNTAAPAASGSLKDRLKALVKPGSANAAAVAKAADGAPSNVLGAPVLAVGINPPDAAREWTAEEQAAESERISGAGKAKASKEEKAAVKAELAADSEGLVGSVLAAEPTTEAKRGPGRPKGSTKTKVGTVDALPSVNSYTASAAMNGGGFDDIELLDDLAQRWLASGNRRGALLLLQAAETAAPSGANAA